jgi:hypothetical protein
MEEVAPPKDFLPKLSVRLDRNASRSPLSFIRNFFSAPMPLPVPAGVAALAVLSVVCLVLYQNGTLIPYPYAEPSKPGPVAATSTLDTVPAEMGLTYAKERPEKARLASRSEAGASSLLPHLSLPATSINTKSTRQDGTRLATLAERIGADNLTVESDSVESAVESLKKMLPHIQGQLVIERSRNGVDDRVLRVMIPPNAYGDLTTELINHGAVEAGAGSQAKPPSLSEKNSGKVILYIRFRNVRGTGLP